MLARARALLKRTPTDSTAAERTLTCAYAHRRMRAHAHMGAAAPHAPADTDYRQLPTMRTDPSIGARTGRSDRERADADELGDGTADLHAKAKQQPPSAATAAR